MPIPKESSCDARRGWSQAPGQITRERQQLRNGENIIGDEENMRCKHALVGIPFNIAS